VPKLVIVVGAGLKNQGGIAAVNSVYQSIGMFDNRPPQGEGAGGRTSSWGCPRGVGVHYFESACEGSKIVKLLYSVWRATLFALWFPRASLIVHLHVSTGASFIRKCLYLLLARSKDAKILIHVHPFSFWDHAESGGSFRRRAVSWALDQADTVIVLTDSAARRARMFASGGKVVVLPNPVDCGALQMSPAPKREKEMVLFLGWYVASKGVYDLIEALARLRERHPALKATFGGCKETLRVKRVVRARGLQGVVAVSGWLEKERVRTLLHECSVLALPTYSEGIPMVMLEAMACGAPIVTCPVGGIPDIVQEGRNVVYVVPGDVQGLTEALHQLLIDEGRRVELSANNANDAREFDVGGLSSRLGAIYERLFDAQ
jgi:glycosyltransferase involved in cell wall biosynthesis